MCKDGLIPGALIGEARPLIDWAPSRYALPSDVAPREQPLVGQLTDCMLVKGCEDTIRRAIFFNAAQGSHSNPALKLS